MTGLRPTALRACLIAGLLAGGACSSGDDASAPPSSASPEAVETDPAAPSAAPTPMLRDADVTDVEALTSALATGAEGEREWIEIFAELRAKSWLASRYPGTYDLTEIYTEEWSVDHAEVLERESLDLGVYLDEPLPVLVSVDPTRELGELVELEVVLESGTTTIRRELDDVALETLPGGLSRGLFTLGQHPSTDRWRIHSVVVLSVVEAAEAGVTP